MANSWIKTNRDLVKHLKSQNLLVDNLLLRAFSSVDRADFVGDKNRKNNLSYADIALPIGFGQTISQPMTVAIMLELLKPGRGQKILDIGYGSGYSSALLAKIVGPKGKVFAIEINSQVAEQGQKNLAKYNLIKSGCVATLTADGTIGLPSQAPFDRVLVSAEAKKIPPALMDQLKVGGILVIPCNGSLIVVKRLSQSKFTETEIPGFAFVPLVTE